MRELSLHVLDLLQNALEAGATRLDVSIEEDLAADRLSIEVRDNGRGMSAETARQALNPFFTTRTTRHVGLGLPLLAAAAQRCDGDLAVDSQPGKGTVVSAAFRHSHIDRAPLGNMAGTLLAFLLGGDDRPLRLCYRHRVGDEAFEFDSAAIEAEVGGLPLSYPPLRDWLRDFIAEGEADLAAMGRGDALQSAVGQKGGNDAKAQES
ncbi:MAG TPA: ATP-binding protein [Anaerolineae bacterium]|nr:ATP-binding protein [Anaerolineae bacterium]